MSESKKRRERKEFCNENKRDEKRTHKKHKVSQGNDASNKLKSSVGREEHKKQVKHEGKNGHSICESASKYLLVMLSDT
jgi:hypothetical protein